MFKVALPSNEGKNTIGITIKELYKRRKEPFPSKIAIREDQLLRFVDSKYYVSVYPTKTQKVQISHNSPDIKFSTQDPTLDKKSK